jgi:hypothetical protein
LRLAFVLSPSADEGDQLRVAAVALFWFVGETIDDSISDLNIFAIR